MTSRVSKARAAVAERALAGWAKALFAPCPRGMPDVGTALRAFTHPTGRSMIAALFSVLMLGGLEGLATAQPASPPAPAVQPAQAQAPRQRVTIGFVDIEGDPRYEPVRAYERLILKTRG